MAFLRIERTSALSADVVFDRITAWDRHSAHIPLTTVSVTSDRSSGVGATMVARTALGRFGFNDPMTVTQWQRPTPGRPGRCRLEKTGRVVFGWAEIEVRPDGDGSRVLWTEDIRMRGVPGVLDPLTRVGGEWMFGRDVDGLLADEVSRSA